MASKKKQKLKLRAKHVQQAQQRPGQRLDDAQAALFAGKPAKAVELAAAALIANLDPSLRMRGENLLTEAHFRVAAETPDMEQRLSHLESAVRLNPRQARLHHHAGVTQLRLGRAAAAMHSFDRALALDAQRPGLRFLHQLAGVMAGEALQTEGFSEAEVNSLHLAQALSNENERANLSSRFAKKSLAGQADGLWQILLQMADQPKSAPVAGFTAQRAMAGQLSDSPMTAYYAGVVALRKGDKTTALPIWRQLAQERALSTVWFKENSTLLTRDYANALAEAQQWQEIASLQPSDAELAADSLLAEVVSAAHFRLGYAAAEANRWDQAMRHWEHSNHLAKDRRSAQNLALAQERLERWADAAASWREMVRRRPRKSGHPDALTDSQVGAIWRRAADCYAQIGDSSEEIACLKNAIKYRETDLDLRLRLVDVYMNEERVEAAHNELERILEIAPDHAPALNRLGAIYQEYDMGNPMPIWQRVVALEPQNQDARNALATCYINLAHSQIPSGFLDRVLNRTPKQQMKILQDGLKELPEHPLLLLELGKIQHRMGDTRSARESLRQAWEAQPNNPVIVGNTMHELLHAKGEEIVEDLLPAVHKIPGLLSTFWISQAERAQECQFDNQWVDRFFEEAIVQAALRNGDDSPAVTFMFICDELQNEKASPALVKKWEERARREAAHAGLNEYIDARAAAMAGDTKKAISLLRKGRQVAEKTNETEAANHFQQIETLLSKPQDLFSQLFGQLGEDALMEMMRDFERMEQTRRRRR
jgi:tetratricopeptide (TPR) repeat protein